MMLTFKKYTYIIPSGGTESYVKVSRTLRVTNGLTPWATVGEFSSSHNTVQTETCPEGVSRTEYRSTSGLPRIRSGQCKAKGRLVQDTRWSLAIWLEQRTSWTGDRETLTERQVCDLKDQMILGRRRSLGRVLN